MCIRDRVEPVRGAAAAAAVAGFRGRAGDARRTAQRRCRDPVSYTHLRAHETVLDLVCRLLLEKKNKQRLEDESK